MDVLVGGIAVIHGLFGESYTTHHSTSSDGGCLGVERRRL
jgi:hypothetical protein